MSLTLLLSNNQEVYNVTYFGCDNDGGTVPIDSTDYTETDTVTVLDNIGSLTKSDYVFDGWNTAFNGTGTTYVAGDIFTILGNSALYAVWSRVAKSVIFDMADNYGGTEMGVRQIDFYRRGSKLNIDTSVSGDASVSTTSYFDSNFQSTRAFETNTTLSKTGAASGTSWLSADTNIPQRLLVSFVGTIIFDNIVINNYHDSGTDTDKGVKNAVITISDDEITDTTYNASISNSTMIYNSQFAQHEANDVEDKQNLLFKEEIMDITSTIGNQFNEELSKGEHDLVNDTLIAVLLNTSFGPFDPTTHSTYADISANEIAASGFGYTQKSKTLTTVSLDQTTSVMTLNADNLTWTASGGDIEATSACAIINDTHVNDTVVCCIEFGANYTATDGTSLTLNVTNGILQITAT